ncbi:type II toxin-antitoxin system VapB family antitoxin [Aurantimonas sp. VKM B-3413]|uniref:type II toxin-antitoxin system VapB family antitoxin n=1 Tax=Aurantimonas sp. VKM B-3413 TaxID=2779401 RepID=UPI001E4731E5|nr:type II toxin-antitoxin system VapB family antitoxin [Aurantimonas sp. VKM B-3413]MCB8836613.1 type II toxin-antitoxin system VapB family antitoxin [Aurantimonas sp. VKM B-3413]
MRTNIEIDDELMSLAKRVSGLKTKREIVQKALEEYVAWRAAEERLLALEGAVNWEGDLDALRRDR